MKQITAIYLLLLRLATTKYFTREDFLAQDFDWSQLAVEEHFFQNNQECSHVREEVTVFQYTMMDKRGKPVNSTVTVAKGYEVDIRTFYDDSQPNKTGKIIFVRFLMNNKLFIIKVQQSKDFKFEYPSNFKLVSAELF